MPLLGAHQSIAGGYARAVERAVERGCQCVQLFTKNSNQWRAKEITAAEAAEFRTALAAAGIAAPLAHNSYLINLASPDRVLWRKSLDAMVIELQRAAMLGIPWVVTHPGAHTTGTEAAGLRRVIRALDDLRRQRGDAPVGILLETTAGQGTCLGWRFEHLAAILAGVRDPDWLGVCFDTCHVFAAGYPLAARKDYLATMREFDHVVGLEQLRAFHLNDSLRELGSRVDRHAHIGRGCLGVDAFRWIVRDPRFAKLPMYLETPKGEEDGVDCDEINLRLLRGL
jgi:deoxyribonuclease IV